MGLNSGGHCLIGVVAHFVFITTLLFAMPISAQNSENVSVVGQWAYGPCVTSYSDNGYLYVGNEILARDKKGNYTTAPGQFPFSGEASYTIDGLSGDIYVVAHSVVCGDYD